MSSKETAATNQLLTLLESRYAIRVIWALRDGHAQTFRLLQDSVGFAAKFSPTSTFCVSSSSIHLQLILGLLFGSLLQLVFPFLTQAIVDTGIGGKDISFIYNVQ